MMRYGFDGLYGHMGWLGGGIAMFIGLILVGLLIYLFVAMAHRHNPGANSANTNAANSATALNILSERYARGEIDDDEYKRKKAELKSS